MSGKPADKELIKKIAEDPILLQKMGYRVYKLFCEDIQNQYDRTCNGRRTN